MGPFYAHELTELLFRAKAYTVDVDLTTTGDPFSASLNLYLTADGNLGAAVADEYRNFESNANGEAGGDYPGLTNGADNWCAFYDTTWRYTYDKPIYVDENNQFWLFAFWSLLDADLGGYQVMSQMGTYDIAFTGTLELESATINVPLYAYGATTGNTVTAATVTITPTEWFPYAQNNCEPQWSINTGTYIPDGTPIAAFNDAAHSMLIPPFF